MAYCRYNITKKMIAKCRKQNTSSFHILFTFLCTKFKLDFPICNKYVFTLISFLYIGRRAKLFYLRHDEQQKEDRSLAGTQSPCNGIMFRHLYFCKIKEIVFLKSKDSIFVFVSLLVLLERLLYL